MGLFKSDAPTPPNPIDTARAATGTNVGTAVANAYLQNIGQVTPAGSLTYATTGTHTWTDPTTGETYSIPTFTATQKMGTLGTDIFNKQQQTQQNLANMANTQSQKISSLLSKPMDVRGAPARGDASKISGLPAAATSFDAGGPVPGSIDAGNITRTYGPEDNYSADRQRVEDALMQRMNPQLQIEQQRVQQQLADQGIRYGSQAYTDAMRNYGMQANDARFGAIAQAGGEQQRMNQMAAQQAAFQNEAQQQNYTQLMGSQAAQFGQNAQQAQFGNLGLAQQLQQQQAAFNAAQAGRGSYMQEQYAQRNQPINEITSLLSGSQVQQPNFINTPGAQIPTTDVAGLLQQGFQNQMGIYNTQQQQQQALMGGILGLGAGALRASDRRMKENITKMGTVFASDDDDERKKLPFYQYSYKEDPSSTMHIGPMAQDVEKITPEAVEEHGGRKFIKPRQVMGSIMRAG